VVPVRDEESSVAKTDTPQEPVDVQGPTRRLDFLSAQDPKALAQAAKDLADLANFAQSVSDNGQNPEKLIDAVKMLVLLQEEEILAPVADSRAGGRGGGST
jgi:hypothetical protein